MACSLPLLLAFKLYSYHRSLTFDKVQPSSHDTIVLIMSDLILIKFQGQISQSASLTPSQLEANYGINSS